MKYTLPFIISLLVGHYIPIHAQRGSRDMPDPFLEKETITIIGIQETIEQSPSSVTFTFTNIQINPGHRVWHIKTVPIIPLKAEPTIDTVPPCIANCPPPPMIIYGRHGAIIVVNGTKIRGAKPNEKTYRGLSPILTGFPADMEPESIPFSLTGICPFNTRH